MSLMNGYDALASFLAASPIGSANAGAAPMVAAVAAPSAAAAPAVGRAGGTNVEVKMLQPSKAPVMTRQHDSALLFIISNPQQMGKTVKDGKESAAARAK